MEDWELSDGCIYLIRELSNVKDSGKEAAQAIASKYLEMMIDIGYIDQFKHAVQLKENLFKSLIEMV